MIFFVGKNVSWTILLGCVMCMTHLTQNEDSNKIFGFWQIFFPEKNIFGCGDRSTFANQNWRWLRKSKWDTDTDEDCRPGAGDRVHTVKPQSGLQAINQSQVVIHEKYDWSKWKQMKWMQPRAEVQHLPVPADGQAAGFCGQSQGGGEKDTGAREICLNFKEN